MLATARLARFSPAVFASIASLCVVGTAVARPDTCAPAGTAEAEDHARNREAMRRGAALAVPTLFAWTVFTAILCFLGFSNAAFAVALAPIAIPLVCVVAIIIACASYSAL